MTSYNTLPRSDVAKDPAKETKKQRKRLEKLPRPVPGFGVSRFVADRGRRKRVGL